MFQSKDFSIMTSSLDTREEGYCIIEVIFDNENHPNDYRFLVANEAFERLTGLANAAGKLMSDLAPHEQQSMKIYGRVAKTGKPECFTYQGATIDHLYDVFAFRIGESEEHQVGVVCRDVAAQKKAVQRLKKSEEQFRLYVTTAADIVYRMSPDWSEIYACEGKNLILESNFSSQNWTENYILPMDKELVQQHIKRAIEHKKEVELEHRVQLANGSIIWVSSRAVPCFDEQGRLLEWFGTARDITHTKQLRANSNFLVEISHTLTQLTNIGHMMSVVGDKIINYFNLSHCAFGEVDTSKQFITITHESKNQNAMSLKYKHRISDFQSDDYQRLSLNGITYSITH